MAISEARRAQENQTILASVIAQKGLVKDLHDSTGKTYTQLSHVGRFTYLDRPGHIVALFEYQNHSVNHLIMVDGNACLSSYATGILDQPHLEMIERTQAFKDLSNHVIVDVVSVY